MRNSCLLVNTYFISSQRSYDQTFELYCLLKSMLSYTISCENEILLEVTRTLFGKELLGIKPSSTNIWGGTNNAISTDIIKGTFDKRRNQDYTYISIVTDKEFYLLDNAVQSVEIKHTFRESMSSSGSKFCFMLVFVSLILRPWRWRLHDPPKCLVIINEIHGVVTQYIEVLKTTAVRTSNPTY
jgi:hypothetical protein